MTRAAAIAHADACFTSGGFRDRLARRIAMPTESQNPERAADLAAYLHTELQPRFRVHGLRLPHADTSQGARALSLRGENRGSGAAHGAGLRPRRCHPRPGRRMARRPVALGVDGIAGPLVRPRHRRQQGPAHRQHGGPAQRAGNTGKLGFNAKYLVEMGEETGSPGLRQVCEANRELFAADLLIASDGPRLRAERPTVFLGARGGLNFDMTIEAREGGHHSGNWGGLLSNPGIQLAHAIASIVSPTGQIRIPAWVPAELPASVRARAGRLRGGRRRRRSAHRSGPR